jgi:hypothetical protein
MSIKSIDPAELEPRMRRVMQAHVELRMLSNFLSFTVRGQQRELADVGEYGDLSGALYPFMDRDEAMKFAHDERGNQFPYTYGIVHIRLCTILETAVNDLAREVVKMGTVDLSSVEARVSAAELMNADEEERATLVVNAIREKKKQGAKSTIEAHERVLDFVGIKKGMHRCVEQALIEAIAVRNVLVHQNGKIDAFFRKQCSGYRKTTISIDEAESHRYFIAVSWYLYDLMCRVLEMDGHPEPEVLVKNKKDIVERLLRKEAEQRGSETPATEPNP